MSTGCECPVAGFCQRHNRNKPPHLHKLCSTDQRYFDYWENPPIATPAPESSLPECPHRNGNLCEIATDISGSPCPTKTEICTACTKDPRPQRLNHTTLTLAYNANPKLDISHLQAIMLGDETGFGTRLSNTLGLLVQPVPGCGCNGKKDVLDTWTKEHISKNMDTIIDWLQREAKVRGIPFSRTLTRGLLNTLLLTS